MFVYTISDEHTFTDAQKGDRLADALGKFASRRNSTYKLVACFTHACTAVFMCRGVKYLVQWQRIPDSH